MPSSAVSPATAAVAPAAPTAAEPAAPAVVAAAVVPTVVAAPTEEAVVAGAGSRAGSPLTAAAAKKVRDDAEDYAYRDHEQYDQKQFHGTILPVDVPGYKDSILPVCVHSLQHTVHPCARARVVY